MSRRRRSRPVAKPAPSRAELLELAYATNVLFIDPRGTPHPVTNEYSTGLSDSPEPAGTRCLTHECFADAWLRRRGERPSEAAEDASSATGFDIGPSEAELILRGWTRVRGCAFTVKQRDKNSLWNMFLAAKARARRCPTPVSELLDSHLGLHSYQAHSIGELEHSAEWAGLGCSGGMGGHVCISRYRGRRFRGGT